MGEGLAIGLEGAGNATVIGTPMAGLLGATTRLTLPRTGIGINIPSEKLYHVNGTPREDFRPKVIVDVSKSNPGKDIFIDTALSNIAGRSARKDLGK